MYRVRDQVALRTAGVIYAVVTLSLIASGAFIDRSAFMPSHDEALMQAAAQTQDMLGSPAQIVAHHISGLDLLLIQAASLQGPTALAMFLLGMVAARRHVFSRLGEQTGILAKTQRIGFSAGLTGAVAYA